MLPDPKGLPDPKNIVTVVVGAQAVVDLEPGPNGDLFYIDHFAGAIHRLTADGEIFSDGFEDGNLDRWSSSVGE